MTNDTGTKLTAVEEIQAAVEKLAALRRASTPAPWAIGFRANVETVAAYDHDRFDAMPETIARTELHSGDGPLIVTMHRTIDAQLAILGFGIRSLNLWRAIANRMNVGSEAFKDLPGYEWVDPDKVDAPERKILALARAINGANS